MTDITTDAVRSSMTSVIHRMSQHICWMYAAAQQATASVDYRLEGEALIVS